MRRAIEDLDFVGSRILSVNCGYEEALHSSSKVLALQREGPVDQGIKCQLVDDC